ncbi:MAG: 1-acyl-sn-glycerol-3-phosphate acyltransferase, partial [Polyangiales bacterium]
FRDAKVIPIASGRENPHAVAHAFDRIAEELEEGNVVCLFPEGQLTHDGHLGPLKPGIERVVARTPVSVIPVRLDGLWGSYFSRKDGQALRKPFRRVWSRVTLTIGRPLSSEEVTVERLLPALGGSTRD